MNWLSLIRTPRMAEHRRLCPDLEGREIWGALRDSLI